ncbi:MAG: nucleotidyl transferase AbiEii/AbiGii toxin family protein [Gammaproteobacteria bacterium]
MTRRCARRGFSKGGACLKKCYFETHRFSEDLDSRSRMRDISWISFRSRSRGGSSKWKPALPGKWLPSSITAQTGQGRGP